MDGRAFAPLAQSFAGMAENFLIDFPGHGQTPPPPENWTTADFADATAKWLETLPRPAKRLWVGHSFGCRVGLQLAARHPEAFDAMVLIGPAGLKRERTLTQKIRIGLKIRSFKLLRIFVPEGPARDRLRARFGSADYRRASGAMRRVLTTVVNEDLSPQAQSVRCPTLLICGAADTETPPEISLRLHEKIGGSQLRILDGYDHYTILSTARHQVASLIKTFMDTTWTS